jgi:hypothetical protein
MLQCGAGCTCSQCRVELWQYSTVAVLLGSCTAQALEKTCTQSNNSAFHTLSLSLSLSLSVSLSLSFSLSLSLSHALSISLFLSDSLSLSISLSLSLSLYLCPFCIHSLFLFRFSFPFSLCFSNRFFFPSPFLCSIPLLFAILSPCARKCDSRVRLMD